VVPLPFQSLLVTCFFQYTFFLPFPTIFPWLHFKPDSCTCISSFFLKCVNYFPSFHSFSHRHLLSAFTNVFRNLFECFIRNISVCAYSYICFHIRVFKW
jgi:hypothetical protein